MDIQSLTVEQFDGGITDNYLDGAPNRFRYGENGVITTNRKFFTRPGSLIFDSTYYQIPAGAQRVGCLIPYGTYLFQQSAKRLYWIESGWNTLQGPTSNHVLSAGDTASYVSWTPWNGHLFLTSDSYPVVQKIYRDGSNVFQVRTAGLPYLASSPTVTKGGAGATNYIYAFIHYYAYTIGTVSFADEGPVTYVAMTSALAPDASTVAITAIPVLANSITDNYDTSSVKIKIYRTLNAGGTFYYIGEVTNATTTYNDSKSDATILAANVTLYTTDGTLDYEPPPKCKYLHLVNNIMYYASILEGSQQLTNTIQQGVPSNPDATNALFRVAVDEAIVGISSFEYTPVVGCTNSMYRLDSNYAKDGSGSLFKQVIAQSVGLISHNSFVKTPKGLFFAGTDGFYWTDGFQSLKVSAEFDARYKAFIANVPAKVTGTYDGINDRVLWTVSANGTDNDTIYCLHLKFGIKPDACFTSWTGGTNFVPTYLLYKDHKILRGDTRGYVFKHDELTFTDPLINTLTAPSTWATKAIIYLYESCAFKFGTSFYRKWVPRVQITASNETKLSLMINSINDIGRKIQSLKMIKFVDSLVWGDEDVLWGDPNIIWGYDGLIEEVRRFPAKGLRCSYKQIQLTNAYCLIEASSSTSSASLNSTSKVVTLSNTTDFDWPIKSVGYYIRFSSDAYTKEFLITARTADTLIVSDATNILPDGTYDWKIYGYPKSEVLNLVNFMIDYAMIGRGEKPYRGEE